MRSFLVIAALALSTLPAGAEGSEAGKMDLNRSVTLTGAEIDAYAAAQVAQARAMDAVSAARPVVEKIKGALTAPAQADKGEK